MQSAMRIILGVDPGSLRTGFGVVAYNSDRVVHVAHGTIVLDKKKNVSERLSDLARDMTTLIEKYSPHHATVEDVFLFKNPRSALILGHARGAVIAMLGMHKIPTTTLSATKIKSLIVGRGQAQKFQVAEMVALRLGIVVPTSKDASDALAAAVAGALVSPQPSRAKE
jgi:crossover junction endodeoxyribonuclease RuvC